MFGSKFLAVLVKRQTIKITNELQRVLLSHRLNYVHVQFAAFLAVILSLGITCIMCDINSTSGSDTNGLHIIHFFHRKLSNAGLVSAVGIV